MDPSLARFLVTGWHDDVAGLMRAYSMGARRGQLSHVLGSRSIFMVAVNSMLAGTLGALVADAAGAPVAGVSLVGVLAGLAYLGVMLEVGRRSFGSAPTEVRFPAT